MATEAALNALCTPQCGSGGHGNQLRDLRLLGEGVQILDTRAMVDFIPPGTRGKLHTGWLSRAAGSKGGASLLTLGASGDRRSLRAAALIRRQSDGGGRPPISMRFATD